MMWIQVREQTRPLSTRLRRSRRSSASLVSTTLVGGNLGILRVVEIVQHRRHDVGTNEKNTGPEMTDKESSPQIQRWK